MKVQILADDGSTLFEGTNIQDAVNYLASDHHVIASIKADIQKAVARIETELGAHPAFTWAQIQLGRASAHLDHFVKGTWTEPPVNTVTVDDRGITITGNVQMTGDLMMDGTDTEG